MSSVNLVANWAVTTLGDDFCGSESVPHGVWADGCLKSADGCPMPRPLPEQSKISDGKGRPLERRPELACCIGRVAIGWSLVEERLGFTMTELLGVEPRRGMAAFRAIAGTPTKVAVVRALAGERLDKEMHAKLDQLLGRYDSAKGSRDRIIQGHWYVSDDHPHAIVWADPVDEEAGASEFWSGFVASGDFHEQVKFARDYSRPRPNYQLFEKSDFEEIFQEFRAVAFALTDFIIELKEAEEQPAPAEG